MKFQNISKDSNSALSGLYFKLRKYNLPYPEAVFDGGYFRQVKCSAPAELDNFISLERTAVFSIMFLLPGPKTLLWAYQVTF